MSLTDMGAALLRRLDPEQAHQLAIKGLALAPLPSPPADDPILHTRLAGLDLPNPVGLAAGLDKNGVNLGCLAACNAGFGAELYGNRACCTGKQERLGNLGGQRR